MLKFNSQDLVYMDCDIKSSKKSVKDGKEVEYEILRFIDHHTKREVYIYNWSGVWLGDVLEENQECIVKGYINSVGRSNWLILTDIGVLIDNNICDPYKKSPGMSKIEPSPY